MVMQVKPLLYSPEEYFKLEETAEFKHEYRDGDIIPMSGGTTNHNQIIVNLCAHLYFALRKQNYRVFTSDVRLWMAEHRLYTYPDLMVIKGDVIYHENRTDTVLNPLVIIEILSESTGSYDRGDKFKYYRSIPEFQEYILIDQYQYSVEQFVKTETGKWQVNFYESADSILTLSTLDFSINLTDLYEQVNFETSEA
ncbi:MULTISPECIES: Uma2 family endonuclease [Planktothrix]|jgi:Uma2 family endonuclease|uniref:Putative restriction endonuclease domain-containing protein n=3 Tax=Microcoleaceae TaxID=1892252 RepID=A0A1J1JER7_PLAAG|nr:MULTISPECIES: Uma2 family endonuclease [Planktothrix]MCB8786864.1 Uma2 family endonuclease [Planktothrix agardhii 1025]MCF3566384.1 Uma2 family endonuclease [Planktothrix agardhii 1807]MCF3575409.1 Uma2 family endonuclease [Planktothrix agardhii 1812]MCF3580760.1 Uma2 family endonuclease [Planktothrix agardhii 1811]MCF3585933.1 Uma2 family endonuclease [Planktothrix agardhii 1803]MCF3602605.1 Uma2 family endonuclease [Planktothrix agardhii 1804]MCF3609237.1 Uma2 family endonuclease [Plank